MTGRDGAHSFDHVLGVKFENHSSDSPLGSVRAGEVASFEGGEAITDDYPGAMPWIFTGGTIKRVAVDISGEPCVDLEREAVAMLSRE